MSTEAIGSANCLASGVQVGEYRLQRVIGEGGFGIVYLAHDLSLDRTVAVKEYMPSTLAGRMASNQIHVRSQHRNAFDAGLRSFINEARLLAKFSHPALVHVYRFFEENGTAYMVMRFYEGQTLRSFLEAHAGRADERWLAGLLGPIFDVLEMLHAADCYHRDIAPDNVFLQSRGGPVLLDFGAARRIIGDMTQALTMVLKPGFAPIEQYVDDGAMPQGAWTDIYQLGAMIYLAIVGRAPATSVARMINDPLKVLTCQDHPGFSERFLRGVQQALAIKPQDRPQSMAEFRALLGISSSLSSGGEWSALTTALPAASRSPDRPEADPLRPQTHSPFTPASAQTGRDAPSTGPGAVSQAPAGPLPVPAGRQEAASVSDGPVMPPSQAAAAEGQGGVRPTRPTVDAVRPERRKPAATPPPVAAVAKPGKGLWLGTGAAAVLAAALAVWWWPSSGEPPQVPAPPVLSDEARQWQMARQDATPEALQAYLQKYPQGLYRDSAQALLDSLQPRPAPEGPPPPAADDRLSGVQPATQAAAASAPEPEPAAADRHDRTAQVEAGRADVPMAPPAKPVAQPPSGKVLLRVIPWGTVSVNQKPVGTTPPLTQLDLPEGQYRIDISNPAAPAVTRMVQVKKGEPVTLSLKFE
ncbi:MAG: protein kinase [Curvibacter sp.]|nr:protein kinase [Curvibacter sp.]